MENTIPATNAPGKGSKWKLLAALVVAVFFLIGFLLWTLYLSPEAREFHRDRATIEQYNKGMTEFEERMKNDTYGGKTPEETLNMFIDAVKKDDLELASKYFVVDNQEEVKENLKKLKEENKIEDLLKKISSAKSYEEDMSNKDDYKFVVFNEKEVIDIYINLERNTYSNVWKIESL